MRFLEGICLRRLTLIPIDIFGLNIHEDVRLIHVSLLDGGWIFFIPRKRSKREKERETRWIEEYL